MTPLDLYNWTLSLPPKVEGKNAIPRCLLEASSKRLRKWVSPPSPWVSNMLIQGQLGPPSLCRVLPEIRGISYWESALRPSLLTRN